MRLPLERFTDIHLLFINSGIFAAQFRVNRHRNAGPSGSTLAAVHYTPDPSQEPYDRSALSYITRPYPDVAGPTMEYPINLLPLYHWIAQMKAQ